MMTHSDHYVTTKRLMKQNVTHPMVWMIEPIFEHYKLYILMPNGERWTITEQDEFTRIYEGIGLLTF